MSKFSRHDFDIPSLGTPTIPSPLNRVRSGINCGFISDEQRVMFDWSFEKILSAMETDAGPITLERAGAREFIYFEPAQTCVAIVTCGGLCPGLNDVIRSIVLTLNYGYGVTNILGIPYGYEGLIPRFGHKPIPLTPKMVSEIHLLGGSILGSSRGHQSPEEMVAFLVKNNINILFVIGGDGTLKGGNCIAEEVAKCGHNISVIGIPKTIDNDIEYLDKSFGFETAFAQAVNSVRCAHAEAKGYPNGIGLVKLMGRDSGFIAAFTALADSSVNYVLIPEVPFQLIGPNGLLNHIQTRLTQRDHAVIVVAEGAGQDLMADQNLGKDASGNTKLGDIGTFLKQQIEAHFKAQKIPLSLKYIDPSYTIRSVPASPQDAIYCLRLAQHAVHAGMAGKTKMVVGRWHQHFVNLPIQVVTLRRRKVNPHGDLWISVLEATGQPPEFK